VLIVGAAPEVVLSSRTILHHLHNEAGAREIQFVRSNWYRDFEIADKPTLEQFASPIILRILDWSEDHLDKFGIKHCYLNFGNDEREVAVVSCSIPMQGSYHSG
jgi:hypothetical protein